MSYNRAIGDQQVTVTYKGNDQYKSSQVVQKVTINDKGATSLILSNNPASVPYNSNNTTLNKAVWDALKIHVVDSGKNPIEFADTDVQMTYNQAIGKQEVTVTYKGMIDTKAVQPR